MNEILNDNLIRYMKDRKALLWIVKEPLDSEDEGRELMKSLATLYWEACWTESGRV